MKPSDAGRVPRRTFIRTATVLGAGLPLAGARALPQASTTTKTTAQVESDFLAAACDPATGRLECWRRDGRPLLAGGVAHATLASGVRSTDEAAYHRTIDVRPFRDVLGEGRQLVMSGADATRQLDFKLSVTVYRSRAAICVECEWRNVSPQPLILESLEPVCATTATGGGLHWPQVTRILTNGPMYYDPGRVLDLAEGSANPVRSWWNVGFFRGYDQEGLAAGFIENQTALGQVVLTRPSLDVIGLRAEAVLAKAFTLMPGQSVRSGRFMLNLAPDPYTALESYADALGRAGSARTHSIVNGWCNWFVTYESITEAEVLHNARFAARELKPFGFEYVQIDEGFQRWHGDWEGNAKFPHGMKWLADRLRALGLKPGLWLAPYVISEPTEVFRQHPEWLLRHPDGRLKRVGPWSDENSEWAKKENPRRYGLDITHPGAAAWLHDLFDTVARRWGYAMIKIDFVDWSLLSAPRYHDPTVSRAQAYRRGIEIMRHAMGPSAHLLDCGPGPVSVGQLDSMRIELDQPPVTWKQYFLESASSAPAAAKRYYFHRRAWINDADHICLNLLPPAQAQAAATLIGLSGGNTMSGDRLPDLDPFRLDILKKVLPAFGEAARPVDLFDSDRPSLFALNVRKAFGQWTVAGCFNPGETAALERVVPLARLGLDPARTYLAHDFWQGTFRGEITRELRLTIPPASVILLALHEKQDAPQVIGTDRHVLQGAVELESVRWNAATRTLDGVSLGPPATAHHLFIHLPKPHPWRQTRPFFFHDFPGYTLKMMGDHILRVRVQFDRSGRVAWQVNPDSLLASA